jgi:hypothetical protein
MKKHISWNSLKEFYCSRWYSSLIIIFSALMILMFFEIKNHRFRSSDFKVYYRAAERLINGDNLYRPDLDGHYYYKYSPTAAAYFIPVSVFPVKVAQALHWTVMACFASLGFYLALVMVRPGFRDDPPLKINNLLLLAALIVGVHLEEEFYLGQVNHILFVSYLLIAFLVSRGKNLPASAIWAITIFIKPFGFIFLPYYLIRKKFKLVSFFIVFTVLLIFLPLPFTGAANFTNQYQHWFHELSIELSAKQSLLADSNHTIFSILARYTPLRLLDFTPEVTKIFQLSITMAIAFIFLFLYYRGRRLKDSYMLETAFLISLIPLLSFTNRYAFQFIELTVICILFNFRKIPKLWQIVAISGFVLSGINMHDLWGKDIWFFLNTISLVAIGAALLQAVLVKLRLQEAKADSSSDIVLKTAV